MVSLENDYEDDKKSLQVEYKLLRRVLTLHGSPRTLRTSLPHV